MGKIFRLVYGAHHGTVVKPGLLEAIRQDLQEAGIKSGIVTGHQPGYVHQMVVYLRNGCDGCLLRRSDGRSAKTGKDTGYILSDFPRKALP